MEILALILFIIVILIGVSRRSPAAKGRRGERRVNSNLERNLPKHEYGIFHDITLSTALGPTQIDHIVVSRHGVFVIETKNYNGWIFGNARSREWTQTIYLKKSRFQNPLRQNYKHTKAVESFLSLSPKCVHSVVVFAGDADFKTDLPDNVTYLRDLCPHILSYQDSLLGPKRAREIAEMLRDHKAGRESRQSPTLAVIHDEPLCHKCGERMVLRTAKKGQNVGKDFWGCPRFPECRGVRQIGPGK